MADSTDADHLPENVTALDVAETVLDFERDKALSIYGRIHVVMREVGGHINKDGKIEMRGGKSIEYISHDAVTAHIRTSCIKHGIFVLPTVTKLENNGNRTELTIEVGFVNIDNPTEFITVTQATGEAAYRVGYLLVPPHCSIGRSL